MRYRFEIKQEARQQLRALPKGQRRNVGRRLDALQIDLSGDVKNSARKHMNIGCEWAVCGCFSLWKEILSACML